MSESFLDPGSFDEDVRVRVQILSSMAGKGLPGGLRSSALLGTCLCLSGCWAPPAGVLRADAPPGLLAPMHVQSRISDARVEAVDCSGRTVTLSAPDAPRGVYPIGPHESGWQGLRAGDEIEARIKLELTVYVPPSKAGETPGDAPQARVLSWDPSYRLLTLQYPGGATDTYKVSLRAPLRAILPGSWVAIRPIAALDLHARRSPLKVADSCAARSAPPAS